MFFVAIGSLGYLVGRTFLYFYQKDKKLNNELKLVNENKYTGSIEIDRGEIPVFDRDYVTKTILEQENESIKHFLDTMQMQYVPFCYNNFIANLSRIEIIPTTLLCKFIRKTDGSIAFVAPDEKNNKLKVWFGENTTDLSKYHELFHVASTVFDNQTKRFYTGFDHSINNNIFGKGINEGYTELLTGRYFNGGKPHRSSAGYNANIILSFLIEKIVGSRDMEDMYYQADLNGLIQSLNKYMDMDSIMKIINNSDALVNTEKVIKKRIKTKLQEENKELWFNIFNESIKILFNVFVDKEIDKYNNNRLSLNEVYTNIKYLYQLLAGYIYDYFGQYLDNDIVQVGYLFNNAMDKIHGKEKDNNSREVY